jgi:hypothetical protein
MKRYTVIRYIIKSLQDNDVMLFQGEQVCREAYKYHREGFLYMPNENAIALAIGIANATDKKVFVFTEDNYVLNNLDVTLQASVSRCTNLFIVMTISGCYNENKNMPNIVSSIANVSGLFFSMGFIVHDYTKKLLNKDFPEVKATWTRARGPLMALIYVDPGEYKNSPELDINFKDHLNSFSEFVKNRDLGTSMFIPPIPMDEGMTLVVEDN